MRGQVLKRDCEGEPGVILGDDGRRYRYSQSQVRDNVLLEAGALVDFIDLGEDARDIYLIPAVQAPPPDVPRAPQVQQQPSGAAAPADHLWSYFLRALSRNYFQFNGRARRAEYWGFTLFLIVTLIALIIIDLTVSITFYGTDENGDPVVLPILTVLFYLYCVIPGIAITVRRLHDVNMSGWMYFINFVPYVGGLILFVFTVLDSKPAPNAYGASPKYGGALMADAFA